MNAFQKSLHAEKILATFRLDQCVFSLLASIMPAFGQESRILRGITSFQQLESGFFNQSLIHARGTEEIHTIGASSLDLLIGNQPANNQRVAENESPARSEQLLCVGENLLSERDMAHDISRENRVKRIVEIGQLFGGIMLFKRCDLADVFTFSQRGSCSDA